MWVAKQNRKETDSHCFIRKVKQLAVDYGGKVVINEKKRTVDFVGSPELVEKLNKAMNLLWS